MTAARPGSVSFEGPGVQGSGLQGSGLQGSGLRGSGLQGSGLQGSLLDVAETPQLHDLAESLRRTTLDHGAWVDVRPGWVGGSDQLFQRLADLVPWHGEQRQMYERVVEVPRLLSFYDESDRLPDPLLARAREVLSAHYAAELGETFRTLGLCLYRDGRDSVAWHGDTIGRGKTQDTMVAIVSLGSPRNLLLRPRDGRHDPQVRTGRTTRRFALGHGDLLVMGGSCQRTWEHAIPKTAKPVGPRISVQFRPSGVR